MLDIRFSSALTVMLHLAVSAQGDEPTTSSGRLAEALGTNPSLVRKLLVPLGAGGLIVSTKGRNGGTRLSRPATEITLAEIYRCAVGEKPLWACRPDGEHVCLVTGNAARYFAELTDEAERAVLDSLGSRTLADAVDEIRRLDREPAAT